MVSIVDRFLEHARIFYFRNGGDEEVYLSSADWMPRNLDRRIELLFPVEAPDGRQKVLEALDAMFQDNVKGRRLQPDGSYKRKRPAKGEEPFRAQLELYREAKRALDRRARAPASRSSRSARPPSDGEGAFPAMSEPRVTTRRGLFEILRGKPPERGHWIKVHRVAMACRFEVTLDDEDARHVEDARAALDEIDAIEAALTWFRETSELSRVNRDAAVGPVAVGPFMAEILSLCRELHSATGGAFDPASTALSRCWGFLERRPRLPAEDELARARACSGMDKVLLDEAARSVRFTAPGVELSFGAVGKGWALDRVARSLRDRGLGRALLSAGGSSQRGFGPQDWELTLEPGRRVLGRLRFRDAALATSGAGEQHFEADGRRYGHVLDPRTGWPAEGVQSASVLASDAAVADALSTAFLVAGPELARSVCAARPGTLALFVLDAQPDEILAVGQRDLVSVEPAAGIRLVHRAPEREPLHPD